MEDLIALFIQILCHGVGVAIVIVIDKLVVRRRDGIVRIVRRVQATLRIPPCLSVVSDIDPGITDEALRCGTELAVFLGLGSLILFIVVLMVGKLKTPRGFIAGIVAPAFITISVWIYFIRARKRFDQGERDTFDKENGDNQGLLRHIGGVLGAV
ncbi:hypothetical protein F4680DRAFT_448858 [Xylaria scruposa]|nr:hypothetical protein F4680DRAFT_448858 [Xylaria scruposa]